MANFAQAGSRITAALLDEIQVAAAIKPTDQSVTLSTTVVSDTALTLPVVASATYLFECYLDFEGGAASSSDLKWQWSVPSGAALSYTCPHINQSGATVINSRQTAASGATAQTAGAGNHLSLLMKGSLVMSSTAGSITLQWAQNASNATPTIVHAQSSLALIRVS